MTSKAPSPATQDASLSTQHFLFSRLDKSVALVIVALLAAIGLTVALGDNVGVILIHTSPAGTARTTSSIIIQFSESMNRDSVIQRFKLQTADGQDVPGNFTWNGTTMFFTPSHVLTPGASYTVLLAQGAQSQTGRVVLADYQSTFTVQTPRIAYIAPANSAPQNIWIADTADPASARQITFSPSGIVDFGVSPDGTKIAFAERNTDTGAADIKLLDLASGGLIQLTNCPDAKCTTPVWRPDGTLIAYQRVDFNTGINIGASPTRIWLLDMSALPPTTRPLFSDSQILSYDPEWSADGNRIAAFDNADQGILVYDFKMDSTLLVSTRAGTSGAISPDGTKLVYPEITVSETEGVRSVLQMADLTNGQITPLTQPDAHVQTERVVWRPDGKALVVAQRSTSTGPAGGAFQLYLLNLEDNSMRQLTDDPQYANGYFSWDPTGQQLLIQRFPGTTPEVWTYDFATQALTRIAANSFFPRWIP
jgi:Tol biopolymer transport system component